MDKYLAEEALVFMRPRDILFSRMRIPEKFSDSKDFIHHVLVRLTINPKIVNSLPIIRVRMDSRGNWRTKKNQWLYTFRVLEKRGLVDKIQVCLLICLSVCLFVCLSDCLFVCLSVCLFVCLSDCLIVYLSVCLFV